MEVADLEQIWKLAGAALVGLAIAAVALHALRSDRGQSRVRRHRPAHRRAGEGAANGRTVLAPGGAMGWPFRRRGTESLRIKPSGSDFHVLWRVDETAVAHLVVDDERAARGLYEWLGRRFGTGAQRLETDEEHDCKERVLRKVKRRKPMRRRLAVIAFGALALKVVEVAGGEVRSAARMVNLEEADELLDLLADFERARALAAPPPARIPRRKTPVEAELVAIEHV